ncbi:MAG: FAD-dependent oxidoreductase [Actinobacteria bacterium]|nr:FAD-dependent oxidoreductase [Actinomycetota bacterium]
MSALPPETTSYWIASTPDTSFPALEGEHSVDVAVVGAGIVGITAAMRLKRESKTVALIESKRSLHGVTGYTTAKLTAGHNVIYTHLERHFGAEGARLYAEANQAAVEEVVRTAAELRIDADLERTRNYVYSESAEDVDRLQQEADACRRAGLPASFTRETELPYPVAGAVVLEEQALFHPRKYLLPLLMAVPGDGSHVFEESRVTRVDGYGGCLVKTELGSVRARDVIVATHLPILDRGFFFAKTHPRRSYVVAAVVEADRAPTGMYISTESPTRSIRSGPAESGRLLLLGGEGHKTGQEPRTDESYARLADWARERFGVESVDYRWSTQDNYSVDRVPYVGRIRRGSEHIYAATGFGGWGMSNGVASGLLLADLVLGRPNPWAALYDANRLKPVAAAVEFTKENSNVAKRWLGDRASAARRRIVSDLSPGEGRVARLNGELVAVYRGDEGGLHAVSAVCTHLACLVAWNPAERSWDCPCHGSRFAADGCVMQGPAVKDLERRDDVISGLD